jgi:nicotinamidase-related amidase
MRTGIIAGLFLLILAAMVGAAEGPNRPEPKPVALDAKGTAILVLDLNARCHDPKQICNQLTPRLGEFLEKARAASVLIVYSVSAAAKGTPLGEVAAPLKRRDGEPIIYPDAFDKFTGGELQSLLKDKGIKTVVITGASTNAAVLYTATTAARMHRYNVVVPMDGMVANTSYEQEYTFHQFTVLPSDAAKQFQFTKLEMVGFK